MTPPVKLLLALTVLALVLLGLGSIPWSSKTRVDVTVIDDQNRPLQGAKVSLISGAGGILAEGLTDERGVLVLQFSPNPNTDWGKHVWKFEFFADGYAAQESPLSISEKRDGTLRAWLPWRKKGDTPPHILLTIQARVTCKKIA